MRTTGICKCGHSDHAHRLDEWIFGSCQICRCAKFDVQLVEPPRPEPMFEEQDLHRRVDECEALIRWLARAYGDNDPIFAFSDFYGNELPANIQLENTWRQVVRQDFSGPKSLEEATKAAQQVSDLDHPGGYHHE